MATSTELITQLYVGYYDRAPDSSGLNYWAGRFNDGMGLLEIAQSFSVQPETRALYSFLGATPVGTADNFLESVYRNLFNRPVDAEGLSYWKGELAAGKPVGRVIVDIISGAQAEDRPIVDNKTSVSLFYASEVSTKLGDPFRLPEARLVLDGVNATAASVTEARALVPTLLVEDLTLTITDPTGALAPLHNAIRQSFHLAWDMWEMHFSRNAPIEIELNYAPDSSGLFGSARSILILPAGEVDLGRPVGQTQVAREIITGNDPNGAEVDGHFTILSNLSDVAFRASFNEAVPANKFDAVSLFAHEIGHILGFATEAAGSGTAITSYQKFIADSGAGGLLFTGPKAILANGGASIALAAGSPIHFADLTDLMGNDISLGQIKLIEPVHIAMLYDMGLPVNLIGVG